HGEQVHRLAPVLAQRDVAPGEILEVAARHLEGAEIAEPGQIAPLPVPGGQQALGAEVPDQVVEQKKRRDSADKKAAIAPIGHPDSCITGRDLPPEKKAL